MKPFPSFWMRVLRLLPIAAALTLLQLSGCIGYVPYGTQFGPEPSTQDGSLPASAPPAQLCGDQQRCLIDVVFDDFGNPLNRAQFEDVLHTAQQAMPPGDGGSLVMVFAHGWHNSAKPSANERRYFQDLVAKAPTQTPGQRVVGIYIGWRGEAIEGHGITKPLALLTFWNRKQAAHQIGQSGAVGELLLRLAAMRRDSPSSRLFVHGLSFGGALLHSAMTTPLTQQILQDARRHDQQCESVKPEYEQPSADLVLLINPAFEAMRIRPQFDSARRYHYRCNWQPRLVIVTTEADFATKWSFPFGRRLSTLLAAYADERSADENVTAVGHHVPFLTHELTAVEPQECDRIRARPAASPRSPTPDTEEPATWCAQADKAFPGAQPVKLQRCDGDAQKPVDQLACHRTIPGHYIRRGDPAKGFVPYRLPLLNIRATSDIMESHTDVRNPTLSSFIFGLLKTVVEDPGMVPRSQPTPPITR